MVIERVYISHTVGCCGWNLDVIYAETMFAKACRTSRWPCHGEADIKMLDWDYRKPNWDMHVEIAKRNRLEVIMAPDYWGGDLGLLIEQVSELQRWCERVLIPIHAWHDDLLYYELALPCAPRFAKQWQGFYSQISSNVTHLLGGSPARHLMFVQYLPLIRTVDGNSLFQSAVRHGAYWDGRWIRTTGNTNRRTNESAFGMSVQAVDRMWRRWNESIS